MSEAAAAGSAGPPRLEALTGLRFLAALAVFLHHYGIPPELSKSLNTMATAGYCGVTVFFVLSGFVLAHNYYDGFRGGFTLAGLRSYAVARFARVYPLYLFVLLWAAAPALLGGQATPQLWEHALALQAWDPRLDVALAYNSAGWSLSVEFFLYACFPLLLLGLRHIDRSTRSLLLGAGGVAALMAAVTIAFSLGPGDSLAWEDPDSAHRWLYRSPLLRLGDFALGMLMARLYPRFSAKPAADRVGAALAAGGGVVIVGLMLWPRHLYSAASFDLSYALPAAALILGLALCGDAGPARWLGGRILVRLGEASYALYLIQLPLLEWAKQFTSVSTSAADYGAASVLIGLMLCAISVGLHDVIEQPLRRALRVALAGPRRERARDAN